MHGTAKEYDVSTRAVCKELGIELKEVPDWNCCGATSAHSLDEDLALTLPARNLKIIEQEGLDVIIPCAACFSRTKICAHTMKNDKDMRRMIEEKVGVEFKLNTNIYHLMELLAEKVGLCEIKKHIKRKLDGLNAVCYYGCLLVRPHGITDLDDKENPRFLDMLMASIGVNAIDWPYKTECCGASLSLSKGDAVTNLVSKMISCAEEADAEAIVTACPLCQANLEMRQGKGQKMPIFYFTELLGLAFGLKEVEEVLKEHLVDTHSVVADNVGAASGREL